MGFAYTIFTKEEDRFISFNEPQGSQVHDQLAVQFGLEVKIKVRKHLQWIRQSAVFDQILYAPLLLGCSLCLNDIADKLIISNSVFIGHVNHLLVLFGQEF